MSERIKPVPLIGRLAVQLKMIDLDQLNQATALHGSDPDKRLGDIFIEQGMMSPAQMDKLQKIQRDLVVKHRAKQALASADREQKPRKQAPVAAAPEAQGVAAPPQPAPPGREAGAKPLAAEVPSPPLEAPAAEPTSPPPNAPVAQPVTPVPTQQASAPAAAPASPPVQPAQASSSSSSASPGDNSESLELVMTRVDEQEVARVNQLLQEAVKAGASDIHIHADAPVKLRLQGVLQARDDKKLSAEEAERFVSAILTPEQQAELCRDGEVDLCYDVPNVGRFRANVYRQQRGFDAVLRSIPALPPTLDELGLPNALAKHTTYHQGMVLITGPAGCGKSSTMAALVNLINEEREEHILTIEDPIEYIHESKRCLVNQRHAGRQTQSFARALRGALREDPDIIVIGELRDLETISLAMTAAETGHFVLATLHTANAVRTVTRMIGAFPSNQQSQVRAMLSESLRCVISQRLAVAADGSGRIPALEILVINKAIGNLIRDEKTVQIRSTMQTGSAHGMCLLEQSLNEFVANGQISKEEALRLAEDKKLITAG